MKCELCNHLTFGVEAMLSEKENKIAHELFDEHMGSLDFEIMIRSKEFKYGMRVAKESIEKHFGKLNVPQQTEKD